ncbi:MAG: GGDEF domain-containing protein [Burkholderiales bacterium]|nr:GGDEF domain-containing protein [Burkholderiales bacterium]
MRTESETGHAHRARQAAGEAARAAGAGRGHTIEYSRRIEAYACRIRASSDAAEIVGILDEALRETRALREDEAAEETRRRAADAEREIEALRAELELVRGLLHEDALTGALNRRGLAAAFEREVARAGRSGASLSIVAIDLDHFKKLNDRHGHAAGDRAIVRIAEVAAGALRPSDAFARVGGEEFALVLSEARLEEARLCALRLQAALAATPLEWNGARIALTFSAGVAEWRPGESLEQCLGRADTALYAAKRAGRNRVRAA